MTVPPIQRTPKILDSNATVQGQVVGAVGEINCLLEKGYGQFLRVNRGGLNGTGSELRTWLFNTTTVFDEVLNNPTAYGAPDATCYDGNGVSCLWWNDFHPGQAIHKVLAGAVANLTGF